MMQVSTASAGPVLPLIRFQSKVPAGAVRGDPAQVSRSLAACEGCLLVVDAAQGVEAQTLANVYLALENELEIIVVLNKVDLPGASCLAAPADPTSLELWVQ